MDAKDISEIDLRNAIQEFSDGERTDHNEQIDYTKLVCYLIHFFDNSGKDFYYPENAENIINLALVEMNRQNGSLPRTRIFFTIIKDGSTFKQAAKDFKTTVGNVKFNFNSSMRFLVNNYASIFK